MERSTRAHLIHSNYTFRRSVLFVSVVQEEGVGKYDVPILPFVLIVMSLLQKGASFCVVCHHNRIRNVSIPMS